jgi:transposase
MKNRFSRRAHISEAEFKLILKYFCQEKTAVQISDLTGISRVTVNKYLGDIRKMILLCDDDVLKQDARRLSAQTFTDQQKSVHRSTALENGKSPSGKSKEMTRGITMAAIEMDGRKLRIHPIGDMRRNRMLHLARSRKAGSKNSGIPNKFCGLVDLKERQYYRLNSDASVKNGKTVVKNADRLWEIFRNRIHRSKGLASNTIFLHLKESELRFNYPRTEIYTMLLKVMHRRNVEVERAA